MDNHEPTDAGGGQRLAELKTRPGLGRVELTHIVAEHDALGGLGSAKVAGAMTAALARAPRVGRRAARARRAARSGPIRRRDASLAGREGLRVPDSQVCFSSTIAARTRDA